MTGAEPRTAPVLAAEAGRALRGLSVSCCLGQSCLSLAICLSVCLSVCLEQGAVGMFWFFQGVGEMSRLGVPELVSKILGMGAGSRLRQL